MKLQPLINLLPKGQLRYIEGGQVKVKLHQDLMSGEYALLKEDPFGISSHTDKNENEKTLTNTTAATKGDILIIDVPRSVKNSFVGRSLNDLLDHHMACVKMPSELLLLTVTNNQKSPYWTGKTKPNIIETYESANKFCALLLEYADNVSSDKSKVVFFDVNKLEIPIKYEARNLEWRFPAEKIEQFLTEPNAQELRLDVFRSTLWSLLKDISADKRCASLLQRGDVFFTHLRHNYAIMRQDFTLERRLEAAKSDSLNFAETINKTVSSIEAKALAIPALAFVAISKIESGGGFSKANLPLYFASLILFIILYLGYHAQTKYLASLKSTIEGAQRELKEELASESNDLTDNFGSLISRIDIANKAKMAVMIMAGIICVVVFCIGSCGTKEEVDTKGQKTPIQKTN